MHADERKEYQRLRDKGWAAKEALRCARINALFVLAEREGLVKFEVVSDQETPDVSYFDTWGLSREEAEKLKKAELQRIENEGAWGIVVHTRFACGELHPVDSCWGFVGNDWQDSGTDVDLKDTALMNIGAHVHAAPDTKPELEARLRALGWENQL